MQGMQVSCPACSKEFQLPGGAPVLVASPSAPPPLPKAQTKPDAPGISHKIPNGLGLVFAAITMTTGGGGRMNSALVTFFAYLLGAGIGYGIEALRIKRTAKIVIASVVGVLIGGGFLFNKAVSDVRQMQAQLDDDSIEQVLIESGMDNDLAEPLAEALQSVANKVEQNGSISPEEIDEIAESSAEAMRFVVGKPKDIPLEKLKEMAEGGDVNAQYQLGENYYSGEGVPKDYIEAVKWCKMAGKQGHAFAHSVLRAIAIDGKAISGEELFAWFKNQAEQGNVKAHFSIGVMYENGETVARNRKEAMKWLKLAAEQGDGEAKMLLNLMGSGF